MSHNIKPIEESERATVAGLLEKHWGARQVVSRGKLLDASLLPGFLAYEGATVIGLITLHFFNAECEVVTLDAFLRGKGIGKALLAAAEAKAREKSCKRLWLITSNDNTGALAFYQKLLFRMVAIHRDAITEARKLKREIPVIGEHGIPIMDEIELEKLLYANETANSGVRTV